MSVVEFCISLFLSLSLSLSLLVCLASILPLDLFFFEAVVVLVGQEIAGAAWTGTSLLCMPEMFYGAVTSDKSFCFNTLPQGTPSLCDSPCFSSVISSCMLLLSST